MAIGSDTKVFALRMPSEMHARLKAMAAEDGRSINSLLLKIISGRLSCDAPVVRLHGVQREWTEPCSEKPETPEI